MPCLPLLPDCNSLFHRVHFNVRSNFWLQERLWWGELNWKLLRQFCWFAMRSSRRKWRVSLLFWFLQIWIYIRFTLPFFVLSHLGIGLKAHILGASTNGGLRMRFWIQRDLFLFLLLLHVLYFTVGLNLRFLALWFWGLHLAGRRIFWGNRFFNFLLKSICLFVMRWDCLSVINLFLIDLDEVQ